MQAYIHKYIAYVHIGLHTYILIYILLFAFFLNGVGTWDGCGQSFGPSFKL